jgi:hypothetical protein
VKIWKSSASVSHYFLLVALLVVARLSAQAAVREVESIGLTVDNLDRELEFFTKVLPFELRIGSPSPLRKPSTTGNSLSCRRFLW